MELSNILQERIHKQWRFLLKQTRYIFNAHASLLIIMITAYLAVIYARFIVSEQAINPIIWIVISVGIALIAFIGHLTTWIQDADSYYLGNLDTQWLQHLKKMRLSSMLLPGILLVIIHMCLMPLANLSNQPFILPLILQLALKWIQMNSQYLYSVNIGRKPLSSIIYFILHAVSLSIGYYFNMFIFLLVPVLIGALVFTFRHGEKSLNWQYIIEQEENRVYALNRVLNLFVDIPMPSSRIKKRMYLNFLYKTSDTAPLYLQKRIFTRSPVYFKLLIQLYTVNLLIIYGLSLYEVSGVISAVFLWLFIMQCEPLLKESMQHAFSPFLPVEKAVYHKAFVQLMKQISWVYTIGCLVVCNSVSIISFIGLVIAVSVLFPLYVQAKIGKME